MKKAVIIGDGVTKGARSPILWNACFKYFDINGEMFAVDVNSKNDLDNFFEEHLRDSNFIGGAVAAPIKQAVTDYFYKNQNNNFELPTNCFYRGSNNNFVCLNTDILAAMHSIERNIDINNIESLAILGDGSVGLSLAKHLQNFSLKKTLYTRNPNKIDIKGYNIHDYEHLFNNLSDYDLIINSTSVGKDGSSSDSLLPKDLIRDKARENLFVYDVNYINGPNQLLRDCNEYGIKCEDGSNMNIMQAVIAFGHALDLQNESQKILEVMREAVADL